MFSCSYRCDASSVLTRSSNNNSIGGFVFLFLGWRFSALALKFWQKNDSTIPTRCELPLQTALASAFLLPPFFLSCLYICILPLIICYDCRQKDFPISFSLVSSPGSTFSFPSFRLRVPRLGRQTGCVGCWRSPYL